jgi:peptide/nickel transport system substrate-binding protein
MKKTLTVLLCLLMVAGTVSGCGGNAGASASAGSAGTISAGQASVIPASEPSSVPNEAASYKKHVIAAISQAITTGDPHLLSNVPHNILFKLTHDRLVCLDSSDMSFHPELAESWQWISDTVLELKLRKDVKFQNGTPLTAADVVFTFERAKGSNTVGSKMVSLDKIAATDDYTVQMTLVSPNVDWLDTLALPMCSIISKAATEADDKEGSWIGTGAWIIEELAASDYVTMKRNENHWSELPKTEKLTLRYIPEASARLIALQNGEVDICNDPSNTELAYITDDPNLSLVQFNSTNCTYFAFNTSKAPGNDQNLRLALAHAINIDDIITAATNGLASKAVSNWGWATYGYYDGFGAYEQNLDLAKEYLAKAYPNGGAKLEISATNAERLTVAQVIQEQCRQIGLGITINELEAAALTSLTAFNTAGHQAMIYGLGWNSCGDDARRPYYKGSNTNKATITDERIMELIDNAVGEFDDAKRKEMYKEIQEINHEKAYYIPLYFAIQSVGVNKNLGGVIWEAHLSHDFTYAYVTE